MNFQEMKIDRRPLLENKNFLSTEITKLISKNDQDDDSIPNIRAIFILVNSILGIGLLSISYCYRIGIFFNFFLTFLLGSLAAISFVFLIDSSEKSGVHDYSKLFGVSFGEKFEWIPDFIITCTLFGVGILYCQFSSSMLKSVFKEITFIPIIFSNKWILVFIPIIIIALPISFLPSISSLSYVSIGSLCLIIIYLFNSVYYFIDEIIHNGFDSKHQIKYFNINSLFLPALSIQATFFDCHPIVFPTLIKLKNGSKKNKLFVLLMVLLIAFLLYTIPGVFTYLTLFDSMQGPVSISYYKKGQIFTLITKGLYSILLVLTVPIIFWACRLAIKGLFFENNNSNLLWNVVGVLILLIAGFIAGYVESIEHVFKYIGGINSPLIVYIFPALYYLRICHNSNIFKTILAYFLIIFGLAIILLCLNQ